MPDPEFNLGLIGYPIGHTLSPLLQTAALASVELPGSYRAFEIRPEQFDAEFGELLAKIRVGKFYGLNVTLPYKRRVIPALDTLTTAAAFAGAVNTIWLDGSQITGDNTDTQGFLNDVSSVWPLEPAGRALILGTGGAALSVAAGLLGKHWRVTLIGRNISDIRLPSTLFEKSATAHQLEFADWESFQFWRKAPEADLVINATPLGMAPNVNQSPWPASLSYPPGCRVYDLVYNPATTRLLTDARAHGHETRGGMGMLVEQAALAFENWTGRRPNRMLMQQALDRRLD